MSAGVAEKVAAAAFNRRLLCYPMGGNHVDGIVGDGYSDHVLIAPAYIATELVRSHAHRNIWLQLPAESECVLLQ